VPFEVIDGTFPDFKKMKGIAVGHVARKGHGIRESVTGPKGKKTRESNNNRAILEICSIPEVEST